MSFRPGFCPRPGCPSATRGPFLWQRKGAFTRRCDGRRVPRFLCLACRRTFSLQSFRADYRLHRPELLPRVFADLVSKVTHRQSGRIQRCSRHTVERHLRALARHCRRFHLAQLQRLIARGGRGGHFQLDELETYETSRRLQPVTVPVLIEAASGFVIETRCAPLPCRGNLRPAERLAKAARERLHGRRRSGSRRAVEQCLLELRPLLGPRRDLWIATDRKPSYAELLRRHFFGRHEHRRISSRAPRGIGSPLFPINHTLARLRDGVSRLVRRTWAAAKARERLELHLHVWTVWRNYLRGMTNRRWRVTPAMAFGASRLRWSLGRMLAWVPTRPVLAQ